MNSMTWTSPAEKLLLIRIGDDLPLSPANDNARLATYCHEHVVQRLFTKINTGFYYKIRISEFFSFFHTLRRSDRSP